MTKKAETKLKEKVLKDLLGEGWFEKIQQVTIRGTPDIIGCVPCAKCNKGLFIALELKVEGGKIDELQKYKLEQIEKYGGLGIVIKDTKELEQVKQWKK